MNYKARYQEVISSGKYIGTMNKIKALAQLNYNNNNKSEGKIEAIALALEDYECMTGIYIDPTKEQYNDIEESIF